MVGQLLDMMQVFSWHIWIPCRNNIQIRYHFTIENPTVEKLQLFFSDKSRKTLLLASFRLFGQYFLVSIKEDNVFCFCGTLAFTLAGRIYFSLCSSLAARVVGRHAPPYKEERAASHVSIADVAG